MTRDDPHRELIILPVLTAVRGPRGGFVLTEKYMNGAAAYAKHWPGPVTSLVELASHPTTDMDHIEVLPDEALTGIELRPSTQEALTKRIGNAALVTAFLSPFELKTAELCNRLDVPIAFVSEYTVETDIQIIHAQTRNPLLRFRREIWARGAEKKRRKALKLAAGLQCNGIPTYEAYRDEIANRLLFFDNRVPKDSVISDAELARKSQEMMAGRPLRLIFGGRMIPMKGVTDLAPFADVLRQRDVPFTLDIYGDGPLRPKIEKQIKALDLADHIKLCGIVDFKTGWVPTLQNDADLFICCHPQGDPSSTYSEVMACGLPIAGYDNEAFQGIVAKSQAGWATPMHDLQALADQVTQLHHDRTQLAGAAYDAREFSAQHSFEATMQRRTQHLIDASRLPDALKS